MGWVGGEVLAEVEFVRGAGEFGEAGEQRDGGFGVVFCGGCETDAELVGLGFEVAGVGAFEELHAGFFEPGGEDAAGGSDSCGGGDG